MSGLFGLFGIFGLFGTFGCGGNGWFGTFGRFGLLGMFGLFGLFGTFGLLFGKFGFCGFWFIWSCIVLSKASLGVFGKRFWGCFISFGSCLPFWCCWFWLGFWGTLLPVLLLFLSFGGTKGGWTCGLLTFWFGCWGTLLPCCPWFCAGFWICPCCPCWFCWTLLNLFWINSCMFNLFWFCCKTLFKLFKNCWFCFSASFICASVLSLPKVINKSVILSGNCNKFLI